MKSKKIVIDARIIATPTGRYVVKLLDYLQEIDRTNQYIVLVKPKDKDFYKPANDNFKIMTTKYKEFTFGEQIGFLLFLYRLKADLVHFTQFHQPMFYLRPKVTTMHDTTLFKYLNQRDGNFLKTFYKYRIKPIVFKRVIGFMLNRSKKVITISKYSKREMLEFINIKAPIDVIYESADRINSAAKPYKPIGRQPFIFFVGNTPPYKNIARLIEAMPQINKQTGVKLLLVGKDNDFTQQLKGLVKKLGLEDIVLWTGFVTDEELAWMYKNAAAYVFPSLSEGFGLPGLEAISYLCPLASSNATCLPEIYGEAAHYFNPEDVDDIAKKTIEVINNKKLRAKLQKAAEQQYKKYSWAKMANQTHKVYMDTLK